MTCDPRTRFPSFSFYGVCVSVLCFAFFCLGGGGDGLAFGQDYYARMKRGNIGYSIICCTALGLAGQGVRDFSLTRCLN